MRSILAAPSVLLAVILLCSGCGAGGGNEIASNTDLDVTGEDTSDVLFDENKVLQVDIQMDPAEYDVLRGEGRSLAELGFQCANEFEYSHFKARLTVDGEVLEDVDIRKKGFLGSLTAARPSFKLNFDTHKPGRRLHSLERMTLNNNQQDTSNSHQCISYAMFRSVGLPAPRCGYARVSVNGEDLGIYSHIESVKKRFLRRHFSSDAGNLYEAQLADFGEGTKGNYQLKTNEDVNDRSDLDAVVAALMADDNNMPGLLGQVVDLDQFIDYWAMEAVTGHWDGATGNANNHYVYRDPNSGMFNFIPWGTDGALSLTHPLNPGTGPLYRFTSIPSRLYAIPEYRERFHQRVLSLLDELWDEDVFNAEVDRIRDLTGATELAMANTRFFFANHEARLRASISGELVQVEKLIADDRAICNKGDITRMQGTFVAGVGSYEYTDSGQLIIVPSSASAPTATPNGIPFAFNSFFMNVFGEVNGATVVLGISIERSQFGPGEISLQGGITTMALVKSDGEGNLPTEGIAGQGSLTFTEPPVLGQPPSFTFSFDLWLLGDLIIAPL